MITPYLGVKTFIHEILLIANRTKLLTLNIKLITKTVNNVSQKRLNGEETRS